MPSRRLRYVRWGRMFFRTLSSHSARISAEAVLVLLRLTIQAQDEGKKLAQKLSAPSQQKPHDGFLANHYYIDGKHWDAYRYTKPLRHPMAMFFRDLCPIL